VVEKAINIVDDDWRLTNQEEYLKGVSLHWSQYTALSETWTHDHCEFCWAEFAEGDEPGTLQFGYTTRDRYRWICEKCFHDFREKFEWTLAT